MNILIVGAQALGVRLAKYLSEEKHDIVVLDDSYSNVDYLLQNTYLNVVCGDACSLNTLEKSNVNNVGCVIATTESDAKNLVVSKLAACVYNVPLEIAVIREVSLAKSESFEIFSKRNFAIDYPIKYWDAVCSYVLEITKIDGIFDFVDLGDDWLIIKTVCKSSSALLNTPFTHLNEALGGINIQVLVVEREGCFIDINAQTVLLPNDKVYFSIEKKDIYFVMKAFGFSGLFSDSLNIFYDNDSDCELVEYLIRNIKNVYTFDVNNLDFDNFNDNGVSTSLILSNDVKVATLSAISLNQHLNKRVIIKEVSGNYFNLLPIENNYVRCDFNDIIFNMIIRNIHSSGIKVLKHLGDNIGKIIEITVTERYPWIGATMKNLYIKNDIIPILISYDGVTKPVNKNDIISMNSKITLFVNDKGFKKIKKLATKI